MPAKTVRNISVSYAGQTYSGSYEVKDDQIAVSSPYGSGSTPVTGKSPSVLANALLMRIAEDYRR